MSKEYLEALEWLLANETIYRGKTRLPISPALRDIKQYLEAIDNTNPSEALKCLEDICNILNEKIIDIKWLFKHEYNTIKQALLEAREMEIENAEYKRVLEIIKYTRVNVYIEIILCDTYYEYLDLDTVKVKSDRWKLNEEEFDLLKAYFGKIIQK